MPLNMGGLPIDYYAIEAVLSHVDKNDIARVYNRGGKYFNRRVELMDWWSKHIEATSFKE